MDRSDLKKAREGECYTFEDVMRLMRQAVNSCIDDIERHCMGIPQGDKDKMLLISKSKLDSLRIKK